MDLLKFLLSVHWDNKLLYMRCKLLNLIFSRHLVFFKSMYVPFVSAGNVIFVMSVNWISAKHIIGILLNSKFRFLKSLWNDWIFSKFEKAILCTHHLPPNQLFCEALYVPELYLCEFSPNLSELSNNSQTCKDFALSKATCICL